MTGACKWMAALSVQIFLTAVMLILGVGCSHSRRLARAEAQAALDHIRCSPAPTIIQQAELDPLPLPVRDYLIKSGVVGKPHLKTFRAKFKGRMRMKEGGSWLPISVIQYSFMDSTLTRIFNIQGRMCGLFPIKGRDKYEKGKGNMLIRPFDLFTAVDQKSESMDRSELVTFLNDMMMFPMAMLNPKVSWSPLNDTSAIATLTDAGLSVSGTFIFSRDHDLINFVTDDRTYDDGRGDVRQAKWWTPVGHHQSMGGIRIPTFGEAVWDFDSHYFPYAAIVVEDVGYNENALY